MEMISFGLWVLITLSLVTIALFFIPFSIKIDSEEKVFHVRWHLFEFGLSLSHQTVLIGFAGMHYRWKRKSSPPMPGQHKNQETETQAKQSSISALLFSQRTLVVEVTPKIIRYLIQLFRRASVREIQWNISSSNLIVNGICYGLFQGIRISNVDFSFNFFEKNRFVGRFSLKIFHIIVPSLLFLVELPYARLFNIYTHRRRNAEQAAGS